MRMENERGSGEMRKREIEKEKGKRRDEKGECKRKGKEER